MRREAGVWPDGHAGLKARGRATRGPAAEPSWQNCIAKRSWGCTRPLATSEKFSAHVKAPTVHALLSGALSFGRVWVVAVAIPFPDCAIALVYHVLS